VPQKLIRNLDELLEYEESILSLNFEGVILRSLNGPYKQGRATWREKNIFKLKREVDEESRIIGLEQEVESLAPSVTNGLGKSEKSRAKEYLLGTGRVGKFVVDYRGERAEKIAPGAFTDKDLEWMWENPGAVLGKMLRYRHFPHGAKDKLRQARALGFFDERTNS
jgi:DNA ligase-1